MIGRMVQKEEGRVQERKERKKENGSNVKLQLSPSRLILRKRQVIEDRKLSKENRE